MLIHIGYAKAASSWCQNRIFRDENSGFYDPYSDNKYEMTFEIIEKSPLNFDMKKTKDKFYSKLDESNNNPAVFSSEGLSGNWFSGGYNKKMIADRIHSIFPNAKILIIIREQNSMLSSVYRQYVYKGGLRSPQEFFIPENINGEQLRPGRGRGPEFTLDHFKYNRIIKYYKKQFGDNNVLVLPLELLKSNKEEFLEKILSFGGATPKKEFSPFGDRENVGISEFTAKFQRYVNLLMNPDYINDYSIYHTQFTEIVGRFLLRSIEYLTPSAIQRKIEGDLDEEIEKIVGDEFKSSNKRTNMLIDYDLKKFGYVI
jgi:hypothetical protein